MRIAEDGSEIRWALTMKHRGEMQGIYYWGPEKSLEDCKEGARYLHKNNRSCEFELTDFASESIIQLH
jgi:hypothetical protein